MVYDNNTKVQLDAEIRQIPLSLLDDHPDNSIYNITEESVRELAASISVYGVLEPLHVKEKEGGRYVIIAGHRRKLASKIAGLESLPCIVIKDTGEANEEEILVEHNRTQREKSVMEKAREFRKLKEKYSKRRGRPSAEEKKSNDWTIIFEKLNISKSTFYLYDNLNDLIPELQEMVDNNAIALSLASKIGGLPQEIQRELFDYLGDDIKHIEPGYVTKLKEQNDRGYLVLEVMQKKLKELEAELEQRRRKEGDIADLEKRIQALRNKKRALEYDLADYANAAVRTREKLLNSGAALVSVVEELVRPIAGARPKIAALLESPIEANTATHLVKWSQVLLEVGQMLEVAAKKAMVIQGGKSEEVKVLGKVQNKTKTRRRNVNA
ncbi:MAG: ParB N-terminal domain-containing protein [Peptococcaceae bacterium MAG4]|nr:ParB N-terminal domain-containing protein [Peptococcaceae bacterium MAG4]